VSLLPDMTNSAGYWSQRFTNDDTPWDLGSVSPPLKAYIDTLTDKNGSILIPGCGNSYEAEYLLSLGFAHITLVDISPVLTQRLEEKFSRYLNKQLQIVTSDFFALQGSFDCILEQTFLSALPPSRRNDYARKMRELLKPGGRMAGILFNKSFPAEGPPFGGSIDEYRQLFSPLFRIHTLEPCYNSAKPRDGGECFLILEAHAS
jgi:SAM-dependent methyltransferase